MHDYVAYINTPGYLPDGDSYTADTAAACWGYLLGELEANGRGWVPADDSDPEGPQDRSPAALAMEELSEADTVGSVHDATPHYAGDHDLGLVYTVDYLPEEDRP